LEVVSVLQQETAAGDFERIEAAVRETERGRWFLDEYASRIRSADAAQILDAIDALEGRAAAREAVVDENLRHLQRLVSLLTRLVDHTSRQNDRAASEIAESLSPPGRLRLDVFGPLDGLSVADKLKFFR
jgi:hypothetical protein